MWFIYYSEFMHRSRVLTRIFAIGGALCIINDLGGLVNNGYVTTMMGVVNYTCMGNAEKQSKTSYVSQRPADFIW